jgi:DNA-binding HxlR family transcriptional regulator
MSRRPSGRRCQPVPVQVREAASLLERRWQLSIIYAALAGALRFNEFADAVAGISPRMLSERLRDLEAAGLVQRTVIPTSPPTVEYRLTARGMRLGPLIEAMRAYAEDPVRDELADGEAPSDEPGGEQSATERPAIEGPPAEEPVGG